MERALDGPWSWVVDFPIGFLLLTQACSAQALASELKPWDQELEHKPFEPDRQQVRGRLGDLGCSLLQHSLVGIGIQIRLLENKAGN